MTDELLSQLRDRVPDPVPDSEVPSLDAPSIQRAATAQVPSPTPPRRPWFAAAAVGLVLSAIALALFTGGKGQPGSEIAGPLASASAAAEATDSSGILYTRTKALTMGTAGDPPYSYYQPIVTEAWVDSGGAGHLRQTELPIEWPGARDRQRATVASDGVITGAVAGRQVTQDADLSQDGFDEALGGGSFPRTRDLSSDPDVLASQLAEIPAGDRPADVARFELAAGVLMKPNTDPSLRAAAFEVLGRIPGATIDDEATDPLGRPSAAVSITSDANGPSTSEVLYFDAETSEAYAFVVRLQEPQDFIDSQVVGSTVLVDSRHVKSMP